MSTIAEVVSIIVISVTILIGFIACCCFQCFRCLYHKVFHHSLLSSLKPHHHHSTPSICTEEQKRLLNHDIELNRVEYGQSKQLEHPIETQAVAINVSSQPHVIVGILRTSSRESSRRRSQRINHRENLEFVLQTEIDTFIRTRKRFDSRQPLTVNIPLVQIIHDEHICKAFKTLQDDYDKEEHFLPESFHDYENLEEFVRAHFIITEQSTADSAPVDQRESAIMVQVKHVTPYQGEDIVFGEFQCGGCNHRWSSASSWKDIWQKCKKCGSKCYPYTQSPLLLHDDGNMMELRSHKVRWCQKCLQLGRSCYRR